MIKGFTVTNFYFLLMLLLIKSPQARSTYINFIKFKFQSFKKFKQEPLGGNVPHSATWDIAMWKCIDKYLEKIRANSHEWRQT